jgi:hypothetical protein
VFFTGEIKKGARHEWARAPALGNDRTIYFFLPLPAFEREALAPPLAFEREALAVALRAGVFLVVAI